MKALEARAAELFLALVELEPAEREALLRARAADDPPLEARVRELLESEDEVPTGFLAGGGPPPASYLEPGARFAGFTILRRLGEGGMGTVYAARQALPRREVALKVVRPGRMSRAALRRFHHEVEVLGNLQHPGIAQIYEAGVATYAADGQEHEQPYFAMELVRGEPILVHAHRHALGHAERLDLVARLCEAVHHAHQRGVLHRDLKAENVLVSADESSAAPPAARRVGRPVVLDFGIARALGSGGTGAERQTRAGELIGTLASMSPEQLAGDDAAIDVRSDVWALGVLLYQLLAGRLPHRLEGRSLPEALRVLRDEEPPAIATLVPALRGDVSTIVGKALAKEPERRYGSALELAEDLRRHLRGEPIRARSDSALYVMRRQLRRHRLALGAAAVVVLVTAAFAVASGLQAAENRRLARREAAARARADTDFRHALDAIATLVEVGEERLAELPWAEGARRELLLTARGFYERLHRGHEEDPELEDALLEARLSAALLQQYLGDDAAALREGEALALDLERSPDGAQRGALALRAWTLIGICRAELGRTAEAEEALRRALQVPASREVLALRADAVDRLAASYVDTRRDAEAEQLLADQLARLEAALEDGGDPALRLPLAKSARIHAALLFETGRLAEAQVQVERAVELLRELVAEDPRRLRTRTQLFLALTNAGLGLATLGRAQQALVVQREAVALGEEVVRDFPDVPEHRELLVRAYLNLSGALADEPEQAETCLRRARELVRGLVAGERALAPQRVLAVAVTNNLVGIALTPRGRFAEALAELEPALGEARSLVRELPDDRFLHDLLGLLALNIARARSGLGEHGAAMDSLAGIEALRREAWLADALAVVEGCLVQALDDPGDDPGRMGASVDAYAEAAAGLAERSLAAGLRLAPGFWDSARFATLRLHPRLDALVQRSGG